MLPFTQDEFFATFTAYNAAIGPAPKVAYVLAAAGLAAALASPARRPGARVLFGVLGVMWVGTGIVYHGVFFSRINPAAYGFAAAFILNGAWLAATALGRRVPEFRLRFSARSVFGLALIGFAAILYPIIGRIFGHAYPAAPSFGTTPCPVTLLTLGVLLLAPEGVPRRLLIIPALWSLIGGAAAILLPVPQDWLLLVAGAVACAVLATRPSRVESAPSARR